MGASARQNKRHDMFQFADPAYLYLLAVVPLVVLLYIYTSVRSRRRLKRYGEAQRVEALVAGRSTRRPVLKFALLLAAWVLVVVMLARPQYGLRTTTQQKRGIEAAVMLDVSNSMRATDVSPNRLERAKLLVSNLIDRMTDDKIAFGVFAGEAYPQLPITNDYASAKLFLNAVTTKMVTLQGTNLAAAIDLANASFTEKKHVGKAIIIITDGENFEGDAQQAAKEAHEQGRQVFILGIGTTAGSQIPTDDGVLIDQEGKPVVTRLNETLCRDVAKAGGGLYLHVDNSDNAQQTLQKALQNMEQATESYDFSAYDEQFRAVGFVVLLLLLGGWLLLPTKSPWLSRLHLFEKKA